jgi:hypothetical protein
VSVAAGDPLHTRALSLELHAAAAGRVAVRGTVIDLRKQGLVPVPGGLQLPGLIHHMELEGEVDAATRVLERFDVRQPAVAFEPSEATRGESCRDPALRLRALAGARLDAAFAARLSAAYGGPRGCTHLLTLARLLASAVPRALDLEAALGGAARRAGERIFARSLHLDGFAAEEGALAISVRLGDVHLAPAARSGGPARDPFDELASQTEVRVLATVDVATTALRALRAAERTRTRETLAAADFADRSAPLQDLVGRPLMAGIGAELVRRFGGGGGSGGPLLDALLNLAPGYVQCVAPVSERWLREGAPGADRPAPATALGAHPDSCYMWRREGALQAQREAIEAAGGASGRGR